MPADLNRLVPLQQGHGRPALYCVHAVSGSAYSYAGLARLLGPGQPVVGLEAPGFDDERTPVRSLPALSAEYADTLTEYQPDGPIQLLGWSMGGVIAFDMAQRLTAAGREVARVVLVDSGLPWVAPLPVEREIQRRFMNDIIGIAALDQEQAAGIAAVFAGRPDDSDPEETFEAVEATGILPEELDAWVLGERYAVFRAHIEALFGFAVSGSYAGPVTHILSAESPSQYMRWDKVASDLTEHTLPGTHHSIWAGESLVAMAALVRQVLLPGPDALDPVDRQGATA
ncbi:alpha/beta fold hydrolase [Streptacidiphilus monticola]|uniref:Alpha/beta fold hydrolase n=1 Tax=Streptacidiphilus monticola TaxID=2161674 RepID=A0ABW1G1R7_9ACTN